MNDAITASAQLTRGGTSIFIGVVAIVASLHAQLNDPITTARDLAFSSTSVAGVQIAIVAGLDIFGDDRWFDVA